MILTNILKQIKKHQQGDFVYPLYDSYCFSNIPEVILYLFGPRKTSPLSGILNEAGIFPASLNKVVLILIDAFGYNQWLTYAHKYEFLKRFTERGVIAPLTSVFPSTSSAALTTIHSGLTPQEHGLPEWHVYFEELSKTIQTLPFKPWNSKVVDQLRSDGVDPKILFNDKTIYNTLRESGVQSYTLIKDFLSSSAYFTLMRDGSVTIGYKDASDFALKLRKKITEATSPAYFHVYWDSIDDISHRYGVYSEHYVAELDGLFHLLQKELLEKLPKDVMDETVFLVTADHGQINVRPQDIVFLNQYPEVFNCLRVAPNGDKILPWGSGRDVFIAAEDGKVDSLRVFLAEVLKDKADVITTQDALKNNLFGHGLLHKQFKSRIGDISILPHGNSLVIYKYFDGWKFSDLATHGGLSPDEMLVPFAVARGGQLV